MAKKDGFSNSIGGKSGSAGYTGTSIKEGGGSFSKGQGKSCNSEGLSPVAPAMKLPTTRPPNKHSGDKM
jgi:hypothetical protein